MVLRRKRAVRGGEQTCRELLVWKACVWTRSRGGENEKGVCVEPHRVVRERRKERSCFDTTIKCVRPTRRASTLPGLVQASGQHRDDAREVPFFFFTWFFWGVCVCVCVCEASSDRVELV